MPAATSSTVSRANLTADFTYNTDFAQVEVDEQQVNLTRFNLVFPEKREFFLEGSGLFDFGKGGNRGGRAASTAISCRLCFSRGALDSNGGAVPDRNAAADSPGKSGRSAIGVLNIQTGAKTPAEASRPTSRFCG